MYIAATVIALASFLAYFIGHCSAGFPPAVRKRARTGADVLAFAGIVASLTSLYGVVH